MNIITVQKSINNTLLPSQHDPIYIFNSDIYQKWLPMHNVLQDHQERETHKISQGEDVSEYLSALQDSRNTNLTSDYTITTSIAYSEPPFIMNCYSIRRQMNCYSWYII